MKQYTSPPCTLNLSGLLSCQESLISNLNSITAMVKVLIINLILTSVKPQRKQSKTNWLIIFLQLGIAVLIRSYVGWESSSEPKEITGFSLKPDGKSDGIIEAVYLKYSKDGVQFECYDSCREIVLVNS